MRIIFLGATYFASAVYEGLIDKGIVPSAIITYPPKESGRGRNLKKNQLALLAEQKNIEYFEIDNFSSEAARETLASLDADLGIVLAFKILPESIFTIPKKGMINLHPSLLPDLRGAAPLNWAIARGYSKSGVSVFSLNKKVDSGSIVYQKEFDIHSEENVNELAIRIVPICVDSLYNAIRLISSENYEPIAQNPEDVSYAPKISNKHLKIDWNRTSLDIHNQIRAFSPKPGCFTFYNGKKVKILKSSTDVIDSPLDCETGEIVVSGNNLYVKTKDSYLKLILIQPENKKAMDSSSFINGYVNSKERTRFEKE